MSKRKKPFLPIDPSVATTRNLIVDLPSDYYTQIGMAIQAHAILETHVSQVVFGLMKLDYTLGRVAFKYRAATVQFELAMNLILALGLAIKADLITLQADIKKCCDRRDELAHCIWVDANGPAILLTDGYYDTPEGKRSRAVLPQSVKIGSNWGVAYRQFILNTDEKVLALKEEIEALHAS